MNINIQFKRAILVTAAIASVVGALSSGAAWAASFSTSCGATAGAAVHFSAPHFASTNQVHTDSTLSSSECVGSGTTLTGVVQVITDPSPRSGPVLHKFTQQATTSAAGHASVGSLGASVSGFAHSTPLSYLYTDSSGNGAATDNNYQASAFGTVNASFSDTLFIKAPAGVSPLTKVDVMLTSILSGSSQVTGLGSVTVDSSLLIRQILDVGRVDLFDTGTTSVVVSVWSQDARPFVGDTDVSIFGFLNATASALAGRALGCMIPGNIWCTSNSSQFGLYYADSGAVGSFGSTANFYIDILTPGASYTSASGVNYLTVPTTVPVPAAVWLLGSGMLGLIDIARRKTHTT